MKAKRSTQQKTEPKYGALVVERELWLRVKAAAEREDRKIVQIVDRAITDYCEKSEATAPIPEGA